THEQQHILITGGSRGLCVVEAPFQTLLLRQIVDATELGSVAAKLKVCARPVVRDERTFHMKDQDFTTSFSVDQTPEEAFDAINNPRGWWSEEIEGNTDQLDSEFTYHYKDAHRCRIKITELVPGKKAVW